MTTGTRQGPVAIPSNPSKPISNIPSTSQTNLRHTFSLSLNRPPTYPLPLVKPIFNIINIMIFKTLSISLAALTTLTVSAVEPAYRNADLPVEERVSDLLGRMTVEEKIGQLEQITGWEGPNAVEIFEQRITSPMGVGSMLNITDPKILDALQDAAVNRTRLGIPVIFARDVIHGYRTIFPIPLGQAASFNPQIAYDGARVAAVEASADGIRWTFAPMIDIARDARWGRMAEGCGEDPYLTSVMGASMVRGFQNDGNTADPTAIAACAKHFIGYGASESGRDYNSTYITERQLRDVYLPPFKAAKDAGAMTFMSSFNDNDGVPSSGNVHTLKEILRDEWGFDGVVVSDWASVAEMINHGFATDGKDAARRGFNAGVDMDMEGHVYVPNLAKLVEEGAVSMADIDKAVANVLRMKFRLGLFDNPGRSADPSKVMYAPEHLAAARNAAVQGVVMLKNSDNLLPLDPSKTKRVLLTGPLADAPYEQMGTWTFDGQKDHTVTILDALRTEYPQVSVTYEPGLPYSRATDTDGSIERALKAAADNDVIICVVGEEAILSGEAHSMADLNLVGDQKKLVDALAATGKPVITVIMAGRALTIGDELDKSTALLYTFHPGTMGGPAIADIIMGKESPSGRMPVTLPKHVGQVPAYYAVRNTGRPALGTETLLKDIPVEAGQTSLGCTSFWLDAGFGPLLPFGYGLTYGDFEYSDIAVDAPEYAKDGVITVTARLTNKGARKATEVAQLYIRDDVGTFTRPVRELKRFDRVTLEPGQSTTVSFSLPVSELAYAGADGKQAVEAGTFTAFVGADSNAPLAAKFSVKE